VAIQRAIDPITSLVQPNSPHTLAKLRVGIPVLTHRAFLSSALEYMSVRDTDAGAMVSPVFLQDLTLTGKRPLAAAVDVQGGVRNLWNRSYYDPAGLAVDAMLQNGRSFFLKLTWHAANDTQ